MFSTIGRYRPPGMSIGMSYPSVRCRRRPRTSARSVKSRSMVYHGPQMHIVVLAWFWIAFGWHCQPAYAQQATVAPAVEASAESLAAWDYDLSAADEALLEKVQRGCFQY